MEKVCVFLADGFEEIEALTVVDMLRRANEEVVMVSIMGRKMVTGSHGISVQADALYGDEFCRSETSGAAGWNAGNETSGGIPAIDSVIGGMEFQGENDRSNLCGSQRIW